MLGNYLNLHFETKGRIFKGFCMRIHDDFHVTYAVVLEGCHSFCIWLDESTSKWHCSKYTSIDEIALLQIIDEINTLTLDLAKE